MSKKELLLSEIDQVPDPFLDELLDFVPFPFSDLTQAKRRPALYNTPEDLKEVEL